MSNSSSTGLFLDSVILSEIDTYAWLVKGVTTTPTFFKREKVNYDDFITQLRAKYPHLELHVEALGPNVEETEREINKITKQPWYDKEKIVLKVPITYDNLQLVGRYSKLGIRFNIHLIFTPQQAVLAALAGGSYGCPLLGRYADEEAEARSSTQDERNAISRKLIKEVVQAVEACNSQTQVMASSIRSIADFDNAVQENAHVITVPTKILDQLFVHDMTSQGITTFLKDMGYRDTV